MVERGNVFSPAMLFFFVFLSLPEQTQPNVMITRPGGSDNDCAKRCKEETDIDCRFYKFHRVKSSCFLSATNDTSLTHMKKIDKPNPSVPGTKPASSWISQLQSRVLLLEKKDDKLKELQREVTDLRTELSGLKNSRALTHHLIRTNKEQQDSNMEAINEKADVLKSEAKRMESAIMTLGELQRSFGKKINTINDERKSTGLSMAMLGQSNKDMKASINELSSLSSQVQQSISEIRKEMTNMEVRFAGLSTDIMEKAASMQAMIGPELKDMKDTQTNLAEALSLITKKIMRLTPRIPELQRLVTTNDGMVSAVAKRVKSIHNEIDGLIGRVTFTESQLRTFLDPASKLSQDRRLLLSHLREEVQGLKGSQKRLQNDVLMEISDRTRLYKELSQIKLSKKMFVSDVENLRRQFQKMDKQMRNIILNGPQGDLISKILHRQVEVLKKMKQVQDQQVNMRNDMGKFSLNMRDLGNIKMDRLAGISPGGGGGDRWNGTYRMNSLNERIANLSRKLDNMSTTNANMEIIKNLQSQLNEGLRRVNSTKLEVEDTVRRYNLGMLHRESPPVMYHAPQTTNYYRRWQRRRDQGELQRLRAQTDTLNKLVNEAVVNNQITSRDSTKLRNLIEKNRMQLGEQVLNNHRNEVSEMVDEKDVSHSAQLHDHLENLHNVLSSLANQEEEDH